MTADTQDTGTDPYTLWDAAYVLGSLSSSQRREYEDHLAACPACKGAVSEISGMNALLALLGRDDVPADEHTATVPPPLSPAVLATLMRRVGTRRRRTRWVTGAVAAVAAAVLALAVLVAVRPGVLTPVTADLPGPRITASAVAMTPVVPSEYEATVALSSHGWGTQIEMTCTYHSWAADTDHHDGDSGDKLVMVAVGRDGSQTPLATWIALPSSTAQPSASTSLRIDEIASVQIVSADTGDVLLQRSL